MSLFPPDEVQGIQQLTDVERKLFRKRVLLPFVLIKRCDYGKIKHCQKVLDLLLKLPPRLKGIVEDSGSDRKSLFFNLDKLDDDEKRSVLDEISSNFDEKLSFDSRWLDFEYEDWKFKQCLKAVLPKNLEFGGYTQTGHIIHVNLRENILPYKHVIGQLLLDKINSCRTVVNKLDMIENEYRCFKPDLIAGKECYETIAKENKFMYRLDFSTVFWNTRLSAEHDRLVNKFDERCAVYDCCAGVGPFVIPSLRKGVKRVVANDLNPSCRKFLEENLVLNQFPSNSITLYCMDAAEFLRDVVADDIAALIYQSTNAESYIFSHASGQSHNNICNVHIIMNLPAISISFLPFLRGLLFSKVESMASISSYRFFFHCYVFVKAEKDVEEQWYRDRAEQLVFEALKEVVIEEIYLVRKVAGRKVMCCVHIQLPHDLLLIDSQCEFMGEPEKLDSDKFCKVDEHICDTNPSADVFTETAKNAINSSLINCSQPICKKAKLS